MLGDRARTHSDRGYRGLSSTARRDLLVLGLTWSAGFVDAISFLGLGSVFTANMTGNTMLLGIALGRGDLPGALRSLIALAGFCLGATAGRPDRHAQRSSASVAPLHHQRPGAGICRTDCAGAGMALGRCSRRGQSRINPTAHHAVSLRDGRTERSRAAHWSFGGDQHRGDGHARGCDGGSRGLASRRGGRRPSGAFPRAQQQRRIWLVRVGVGYLRRWRAGGRGGAGPLAKRLRVARRGSGRIGRRNGRNPMAAHEPRVPRRLGGSELTR